MGGDVIEREAAAVSGIADGKPPEGAIRRVP
jgi:hypothetical protein